MYIDFFTFIYFCFLDFAILTVGNYCSIMMSTLETEFKEDYTLNYLFTSEQISAGHPDKVCDQISDAILDFCLHRDPLSRVACETLGKDNRIILAGEITSQAYDELIRSLKTIIYETLVDIGIESEEAESYKITNLLNRQSSDIAMGVDGGGAGDQGIMFGFATNETKSYMPLAFVIATEALVRLKKLNNPMLKPDAKSQVTIEYSDDGVKIDTFLISVQHDESVNQDYVSRIIVPIMKNIAMEHGLNTDFKVLVNPTGRFVIGGFYGDAGLTGRKIIADTYGGYSRHGGGAFSGKDPTKVDRSGAYVARWIAKNIVASDFADMCEVQLSYAIGVVQPISLFIETFGTEKVDIGLLQEKILSEYDLSQRGIIDMFGLRKPIFYRTASYGHFGRDFFPWEKTNWTIHMN